MKLRRAFLLLSAVSPTALGMPLRPRCIVEGHSNGVTVLLAEDTSAPSRISASVQRALPSFKQEMIGAVGTQNEIRWSVVGANVILVMDFLFALQEAAKSAFDNQVMLKHVPATIRAWMFRRANQHISMAIGSDTTPPIGIAFAAMPSHRVADAEQHGFAFPLDPPSPIVTPLRNGSMTSTSTSAESRRVRQAALQVRVQAAKITISTRRTYV